MQPPFHYFSLKDVNNTKPILLRAERLCTHDPQYCLTDCSICSPHPIQASHIDDLVVSCSKLLLYVTTSCYDGNMVIVEHSTAAHRPPSTIEVGDCDRVFFRDHSGLKNREVS